MKEGININKNFLNIGLARQVLLVLLCLLFLIYLTGVSAKGGDFASYLEASAKMIKGMDIYAPPYIHLRYSYSPFWAMVLMPLALLPITVGVFIWGLINLLLLCRTIYILRSFFEIKFPSPKFDITLWTCILLFMSRFIELNFHHSQMTIFLFWSMIESVRLSYMGKDTEAGVLIGIATIIKIMPIVMIPYFIYRNKFKSAIISLISIVIAFFLPIFFVGKEMFWDLNRTWFQILRPDNSDFQWDITDYFSHNLSSLLYRLFMKTDAPYLKNIFSLDYSTATKCIWVIILLLIIMTVYFLASYPFKTISLKRHILYEISYISLIMPLIFPHQMKYAFYFLLPAICILFKYLVEEYKKNGNLNFTQKITLVLILCSFVLCTLTTDLLLGIHYSIVTQYLKTITIGTLLIIPALAINRHYFTKD